MNEREQQYLQVKSQPNNEKYANGSGGEIVRLMDRGGCLPVRGSKGIKWKYDDDLFVWRIRCIYILSVNAMIR